MNLQQLEYIIAVDDHRHFATAAAESFVTQPTLSMMIRKLEDELGLVIFDRSKHPVEPTRHGREIIRQARQIVVQTSALKDYARELKGEVSGDLRLGIIPTLAPYLLPLFIDEFHKAYPLLHIHVKEMVTEDLLISLYKGELDAGIMATPAGSNTMLEYPLFYEEFVVYASSHEKLSRKKYILPKEINVNHLWLLQEGHCLRNQVFNLCELKQQDEAAVQYEAGSIETLINLVDRARGITIIPKLAELNLSPDQRKQVYEFANPRPVREVSIVVSVNFSRKKVLSCLQEYIVRSLPAEVLNTRSRRVTAIS